jgi:iron complex outermembrane receptor protein
MIANQKKIRLHHVLVAALLIGSHQPRALAQAAPSGSGSGPAAGEANPIQVGSTVVTGSADALAAETPAAAAAALAQVPGGTGLVDSAQDLKSDPALSQKAVFDLQPSVYAEGSGSSEGVKISIRGSGIGNPVTYNRGVNILFDGLTFPGFAMSGNAVIFNETLGLAYTEVLPGANGFDYQSLGLGGAINYVSPTGYNSDRWLERVDFGSFGYVSDQVSTGQVVGKFDDYVSIVAARSDGFQTQSKKDSIRLISDFGYKFNDSVDTRIYLRYGSEYIQNPGSLTLAQINSNIDLSQSTTFKGVTTLNNVQGDNYSLNPWAVWLGSKTTVKLDRDSQLTLGATYDNIPYTIYSTLPYAIATAIPSYTTLYNEQDATYLAGYERDGLIGGLPSTLNVDFRGLAVLYGDNASIDQRPGSPRLNGTIRERHTEGTGNDVLSASDNLELAKGLWFKAGVSGIHDDTVNKVIVALDGTTPINNSQDRSGGYNYNYVTGLTYDAAPGIQLYANVSRSVEQPTALSMSNSLTNASSVRLQDQVGITEEAGVRGTLGIFEGSLSVYQTDLDNEFLTVVINPNTSPATTQSNNASPTRHRGIEAGLGTTLWQAEQAGGAKAAVSKLVFRQTYTLNDFYFRGDPQYGKNFIPSIPLVVYQAELRYEDASGVYLAVNTRASSSTYADYTNTFQVPGYGIYGAAIGYEPAKGRWSAYLTVENIGDKAYAATVKPNFNNAGTDSAALYAPGDPRGFYAGFAFHF